MVNELKANKKLVKQLLAKTHAEGIPYRTTAETMEAYKMLKLLAYLWFRDKELR